jgi:hypothetical protein
MRYVLMCWFLVVAFAVKCQVNPGIFNAYDDKHKKHGLWKIFLGQNLWIAKTESEAYYYTYNYYEHGQLVIYGTSGGKYKKKAIKVIHEGKLPEKGKPVALNGNYKIYTARGLEEEEEYKDGLPVYEISYDTKDTTDGWTKIELLDYSKPYHGQFGSFYYELYYGDGSIRNKFWFGRNEKGKWNFIKTL